MPLASIAHCNTICSQCNLHASTEFTQWQGTAHRCSWTISQDGGYLVCGHARLAACAVHCVKPCTQLPECGQAHIELRLQLPRLHAIEILCTTG